MRRGPFAQLLAVMVIKSPLVGSSGLAVTAVPWKANLDMLLAIKREVMG